MSDKDTVIQFTRGVMDRIRDHIKEKFPESWKDIEEIKTEIVGKTLKNGEAVYCIKERDESVETLDK